MTGADTVWDHQRALVRDAEVLGAASVVAGLAVAALGRRRVDRRLLHFGLQNAAWGATNIAIGIVADRVRVRKMARLPDPHAPTALRAAHRRLRRLLLLNVGLDASYVVGGLALLRWRGRQGHAAGTGASAGVVVQGLALFLHDVSHTRSLGRPP